VELGKLNNCAREKSGIFLLVPIAGNMENIINIDAYGKNINSADAHSGGAARLCK
jgi:hypothetical protein